MKLKIHKLAFKYQYNLAFYVCTDKLLYLPLSNFYDPTQFLSSSPEALFSIFLDIFVYIRSTDLSYVAGTFLDFFASVSLSLPFLNMMKKKQNLNSNTCSQVVNPIQHS